MNESLFLLIGSIAMLIMALAIIFFIYMYQRKLIRRKLENQQIQDLLQQQGVQTTYALLEGQDKERKRIASELHDNLGSILVTMNIYADSLVTKSKKEEVEDLSHRISETSKKANEAVRQISHSLDSGLLKHFGLKVAITQLLEAVEMAKKIKVTMELNIDDHISNEKGLEVYRIIQELVNNSLKHSRCSSIRVEANQIRDSLSIIYEDNGKGFDPNEIKRGMGLNNIEHRIEKLEGTLEMDSSSGKGSTFILELPVS